MFICLVCFGLVSILVSTSTSDFDLRLWFLHILALLPLGGLSQFVFFVNGIHYFREVNSRGLVRWFHYILPLFGSLVARLCRFRAWQGLWERWALLLRENAQTIWVSWACQAGNCVLMVEWPEALWDRFVQNAEVYHSCRELLLLVCCASMWHQLLKLVNLDFKIWVVGIKFSRQNDFLDCSRYRIFEWFMIHNLFEVDFRFRQLKVL